MKPKVMVLDRPANRSARAKIKKMAEAVLKSLDLCDFEVSILLTDDGGIRDLNKRFRNINRPTDVLSFPMEDERLLGDIAVSLDTAGMQARDLRISLEEELGRLVVHGMLHLLGYDHVKGGYGARKMRAKEDELLKVLRSEGCLG